MSRLGVCAFETGGSGFFRARTEIALSERGLQRGLQLGKVEGSEQGSGFQMAGLCRTGKQKVVSGPSGAVRRA